MFYALSRTFSNSAETYYTIVAFYFWPFPTAIASATTPQHIQSRRVALIIASIACILRVTNAVIWIPLVLRECVTLYQIRRYDLWFHFLIDIVTIAVISISFMIGLDSWYYGEFTITPLNFYHFNTTLNGSALYGTHPLYWYFMVGIPTVIGTMTPNLFYAVKFIHSMWNKPNTEKGHHRTYFALISKLFPLICCLWTVMVFSLNPHKEFRFLSPVLPILMIYCGVGLFQVFRSYPSISKMVLILLATTNGFAGLYLSQFHQSAPIEVMQWLHKEIYTKVEVDFVYSSYGDVTVAMVLPCHSTPHHSYLHLGDVDNHVDLRFLECDPHFGGEGMLTRTHTQSWWLEVHPQEYFSKLAERLMEEEGVVKCRQNMVVSSHHMDFVQEYVMDPCGYSEGARFTDNLLENKYLVIMHRV